MNIFIYISFDIYTGNTGNFFSDSLWHGEKPSLSSYTSFKAVSLPLSLTENGGRLCK